MSKEDKRVEDLGPDGRRLDVKSFVMIIALAANVGAVVWKGGEISGKFDALLEKVGAMNVQIQAVAIDQNSTGRLLSAQQEQLKNHEGRLNRIEDRNARMP